MDGDIAARVKACHFCGLNKPAQNTKLGLLSSDVASRPMEKLFIDYVGPVSYTHLDVYKRQHI